MTGQALAIRNANDLAEFVRSDDFQQQLEIALPEGVNARRFGRALVTALLQNADLAQTPDKASLFAALIRSAQDGLVPDGREAAIVRRGDKAVYHPMIHGFHAIAAEHGWTMRSQVVYLNDEFDYSEEPPEIRHRPVRPGAERGPLVAAYSIAVHRDGRRMQRVLHEEDVTKRRGKATTQSVWNEWTPQMWMKSAGRALFQDLPITDRDRVARVLAADDPAQSADVLYGPGAGQVFNASPADPVVRADGAPDVAAARGAAQEAGDAASPSPGASPAPAFTDGEEETAVADSAGQFRVPAKAKPFGGLTIAEAHGQQDGPDFLRYALDPARPWAKPEHPDHLFYEACRTYAAVYAPDLIDAEGSVAA